MSKSWLGHDLNDGPKEGSENNNPQEGSESGPPPTEPNVKGKPHHLEARLAQLDPELQSLFEKVVADKVNAERNFRMADERLRKTETKLNEISTREAEAEKKRLEQQGEFKVLAEKAEARARELEEKLVQREIQLNLDRELSAAGVLDTDFVSTALSAKYGDELKADPSKVSSIVARVKEDKPHLFKAAQTPPPSASEQKPAMQATGQSGSQPPAGAATPSQFNARDRKVPLAEVEARYAEMMKNAEFPLGNTF